MTSIINRIGAKHPTVVRFSFFFHVQYLHTFDDTSVSIAVTNKVPLKPERRGRAPQAISVRTVGQPSAQGLEAIAKLLIDHAQSISLLSEWHVKA
jgi:hypothetical protein